jgi:hypothetical protein
MASFAARVSLWEQANQRLLELHEEMSAQLRTQAKEVERLREAQCRQILWHSAKMGSLEGSREGSIKPAQPPSRDPSPAKSAGATGAPMPESRTPRARASEQAPAEAPSGAPAGAPAVAARRCSSGSVTASEPAERRRNANSPTRPARDGGATPRREQRTPRPRAATASGGRDVVA